MNILDEAAKIVDECGWDLPSPYASEIMNASIANNFQRLSLTMGGPDEAQTMRDAADTMYREIGQDPGYSKIKYDV